MVQAVPVHPNWPTLSFTGLWGVPWQKSVTLHVLNIIKSLQVPFFVNPAFENMPALKQTEHIETVHILIPRARWHICRAEAAILSVMFLKSVSRIKKGTLSPSRLFQKHSALYLLTKRCFQERTKWPPVTFIIHLIFNIDLIWNHLKYTLLDISEKVFPKWPEKHPECWWQDPMGQGSRFISAFLHCEHSVTSSSPCLLHQNRLHSLSNHSPKQSALDSSLSTWHKPKSLGRGSLSWERSDCRQVCREFY